MKKVINNKSARARLVRGSTPGGEMYSCMRNFGWDQVDLAKVLDVSEATVSNLLNGRTTITVQLADILSQVFGGSAEYWLLKQLEYFNEQNSKSEDAKALRLKAMLYKLFPIRDLFQIGWISSDSDITVIERELSTLLGKQTYNRLCKEGFSRDSLKYHFYKETGQTQELLWVSKARSIIPKTKYAPYSKEKLQKILDSINENPLDKDGVTQLLHALDEAGVAFKILRSLPKLIVVGGLLWVTTNPAFVYAMRSTSITAFKGFIITMISACLVYEDVSTTMPTDISGNVDNSINCHNCENTFGKISIHCAENVINRGFYVYEKERLEQLHLIPNYDVLLSFAIPERMTKFSKQEIMAESGRIEFPEQCYYKGGNK